MRDLPESECTDDTPSILHFGCQSTEMAEWLKFGTRHMDRHEL